MEYLDTKVLESLMIDESMIATESFSDKLKAVASKALQLAKTFFKALINMVRKLINTIKEKSRIRKEIGKNAVKIDTGLIIKTLEDAKSYAKHTQAIVNIMWVPNNKSIDYVDQEIRQRVQALERLKDLIRTRRNLILTKYGDKNCYIDADMADKILKECFTLNEQFEKAYNSFGEMYRQATSNIYKDVTNAQIHRTIAENATYFTNGIEDVIGAFSIIQKCITDATYDYGDTSAKVIDTRMATK